MADMPDPHGDDAGVGPNRESTAPAPFWVKVFGVIALVVVLVFVALLLTGRGHGPGRHTGAGGGHTPPSGHMDES